MEIKILENDKTRFVFETETVDHALFNALKMALWDNKDIHVAGYNVSHPLVGKTRFIVEMKKGNAKKALQDAVKGLKSDFSDLAKQAAKL